jgi:hypothetical protein
MVPPYYKEPILNLLVHAFLHNGYQAHLDYKILHHSNHLLTHPLPPGSSSLSSLPYLIGHFN